jgi:glyoxylase-like metal-dependent hydrolase (beta-lactamase superfamily II)
MTLYLRPYDPVIFMQITENIWQVGGGDLTSPEDAAVYLVCFGDSAALIDAGCGYGHDRLVQNVSRNLPSSAKVEYLFLTHCHYDHVGGAEAVRRHYGCKIVAHELDAVYLERGNSEVTAALWYGETMIPFTVDCKITGTEQMFQVGSGEIRALHCPGHSPGSVMYVIESEGKKVLFGQDIHGPLNISLLSDQEDYIRSLLRLIDLKADILCEGHFGIYQGKEEVRQFIESFM